MLLGACNNQEEITFNHTAIGSINGSISIVETNLIIPAAGGRGYVVVESKETVSAATQQEQEWCSIEIVADTIFVAAIPNISIIGRNAVVAISSSAAVIYVTFSQDGQQTDISSLPDRIDCLFDGTTATYTISSNVEVETLSSQPDWAHISVDDNIVTILVDKTLELDDRTCTLTVKTENKMQTILITQVGRFKLSATTALFPKTGSTQEFSLVSADDVTLILEDTSWCRATYDDSTYLLTVTCDKFVGTDRGRDNKLTIRTSIGNTKTIDITQELTYGDYIGSWLMEFRWTDDYDTYDHDEYPDEYEHVNVKFIELERGRSLFCTGLFNNEKFA